MKLNFNFELLKKYVFSTLVHELGHWLMAKKVGFPTGQLEVTVEFSPTGTFVSGSATIFLQKPIKNFRNVQDYIEKRIAVLGGGALAESYLTCPPGVDRIDHFKRVLGSNGENDYAKADEHMNLLRNIIHADSLDLEKGPVERWQILGRAVEKFDFSENDKKLLDSTANEFMGEVMEKSEKRHTFKHIFNEERLSKFLYQGPPT
jgi:hypothetical protein